MFDPQDMVFMLKHCPDCANEFHRLHGFEQHLKDDHANFIIEGTYVVPRAALKLSARPQIPTAYAGENLPALQDEYTLVPGVLPNRLTISLRGARASLQPWREEQRWGYWGTRDRYHLPNSRV